MASIFCYDVIFNLIWKLLFGGVPQGWKYCDGHDSLKISSDYLQNIYILEIFVEYS